MEGKENITQAINKHLEGLNKEELIMVLNFIYNIEYFRQGGNRSMENKPGFPVITVPATINNVMEEE